MFFQHIKEINYNNVIKEIMEKNNKKNKKAKLESDKSTHNR